MNHTNDGCPCLYTTPCQPNCTCVKPMMSHGCRRCVKYGNSDQKRQMAKNLAEIIAAAKALLSEMREAAASICDAVNQELATKIRALEFPKKRFQSPYNCEV